MEKLALTFDLLLERISGLPARTGALATARRLYAMRNFAVLTLSIYQFIRHLQSFGSGRHSRRSLMARRRPRVNQESFPRASSAGWRSGCFFRQGLGCWLG